MRTLALAAALPLALLAAAPAPAEDLPTLTLAPGEQRVVGGHTPICDDPKVAVISAQGVGVVQAVGKGETVCSVQRPGGRKVFRVVVREPQGGAGAGAGGASGGGQ